MNRNTKKGFTIVELIIVIAVIAVLAAVLIPTFSNLIQKANEAKDTALVSNLNKAVAMDTSKNETVYDVLTTVRENAGYDVGKINAAATNNEILWDSANNCFVYSVNGEIKYIPDTEKTPVGNQTYKFWKLSDKKADVEAGVYSIYWTGAALSEITAKTGFDAGDAQIGKIIYEREDNATAQTVTIRTNGGELEVSAKPDTVYHYDVASKVVVTKVHNASYHENGTVVGNLEVKEGHVELGAKADVTTVIVAPTTANAATVTVATGATVGVVAATTDEGKNYLDNATTVPSDKKAETKLDESVLSQFAGGIGTEASPYLIANAEQFNNINNLYSEKVVRQEYNGKTYYFQQIADIEFEKLSIIRAFTGTYDGNNKIISFKDNVQYKEAWLFQHVFNKTIIKNMNYQLKKNQPISLVYSTDWYADTSDLMFQNINIDSNKETVVANSSNFGFFALYTNFNISKVRYENCVNNANLNNSGTSTGVFLGSGWVFDKGATEKIEFINCKNMGNITGTASTGVLYGNSAYVGSYVGDKKEETEYSENNFVVENVENTGTITSNLNVGKAGVAPASKLFDSKVKNSGTYIVGGCFDGKTVKVDLSNGNNMKFAVNGSSDGITYKIAFNINVIWNKDNTQSNTTKYFFDIQKDNAVANNVLTASYVANSEEIATKNGIEDTSKLTYNNEGIAVVVQTNKTILVFKDGSIGERKIGTNGSGESTVSVYLYAYDNDGLCIGTYRVK